jgi:centractin
MKENETQVSSGSFIGKEALANRGVCSLKHFWTEDFELDTESITQILACIFSKELAIEPKEHQVLITEPIFNSQTNRNRLAQVLFETFNVPSLLIYPQAILPLYAMGKNSGLVVDSGELFTQIVPVVHGYVLAHAAKKLPFAGRKVTEVLTLLLLKNGTRLLNSNDKEVVRRIKEENCYLDTENKYESSVFHLPDGQTIKVQAEATRVPELLFSPERYNLECEPLHQAIWESISRCDTDVRALLFENIVLAGGNTLFRGFAAKLLAELKKCTEEKVKITIYSPKERQISGWKGGSIFSSMQTFQKAAFTAQEFALDSQVVQKFKI